MEWDWHPTTVVYVPHPWGLDLHGNTGGGDGVGHAAVAKQPVVRNVGGSGLGYFPGPVMGETERVGTSGQVLSLRCPGLGGGDSADGGGGGGGGGADGEQPRLCASEGLSQGMQRQAQQQQQAQAPQQLQPLNGSSTPSGAVRPGGLLENMGGLGM